MGQTIRVAEDSISGVKATSTAPTAAMRSLLDCPGPPASSSRRLPPLWLSFLVDFQQYGTPAVQKHGTPGGLVPHVTGCTAGPAGRPRDGCTTGSEGDARPFLREGGGDRHGAGPTRLVEPEFWAGPYLGIPFWSDFWG
jgi:hypothetical protein